MLSTEKNKWRAKSNIERGRPELARGHHRRGRLRQRVGLPRLPGRPVRGRGGRHGLRRVRARPVRTLVITSPTLSSPSRPRLPHHPTPQTFNPTSHEPPAVHTRHHFPHALKSFSASLAPSPKTSNLNPASHEPPALHTRHHFPHAHKSFSASLAPSPNTSNLQPRIT